MPTIATLDGISIYIYFGDHTPPHVHAYAAENDGKFRIADGVMIAGDLPTKSRRKLRKWLDEIRDFALRKWREIAEA